jgi:hypothetical protein
MSSVAVDNNGPVVTLYYVMEYGNVLLFIKLTLYGDYDYKKRKRGRNIWNTLS